MSNETKGKRVKVSQSDIPRFTIEQSLVIARALWDDFGGKSGEPHQIAISLDLAPTSGYWRNLCGASIAYGLTEGGYNAKEICLTSLGRAIVAPEYDGQDSEAIIEASLKPAIIRSFFEKYDKAKFPSPQIGANVLVSLGVPKERADQAYELVSKIGEFAGIISQTKSGLFVSISSVGKASLNKPLQNEALEEEDNQGNEAEIDMDKFARRIAGKPQPINSTDTIDLPVKNNRVFISHGKNKEVVEQLKEILKFGRYEPVVSVDNETTSIPVPDKVLDDMRSCSAGIINVHSEGELLDSKGNTHIKINDNVLIEIGAAMALYGRNYILLVQKGIKLPSNLQGLYRCEYEGEKLDYDATMKLLKAFNQFG